jgi:iron(III) transport system substrate-binding protein
MAAMAEDNARQQTGRNAMTPILRGIIAAIVAAILARPAAAQEPPALQGAAGDEKARLTALIDGARKEGSLTYWDVVIQPETNDALTAAFRKHYGLPNSFAVNYQLSATAALVTRVEQEINANRVTVDVAAAGSPSWVFERAAAGDALEYDSPQYRYYADVIARGLGKKGVFAFNGAYLFVPMWSADRLKFDGKSWKDVVNAVPPGRMSIGDVSKSVAYLATYAGQREVLNQDYFKSIAKMKPSFLIRSEQIAGRLVTGEDLMSFSGMPTRAYQYNQKGGKLKFIFPTEGSVLLPQNMFILKKAPHPNAAKLWVDFILSEEGQTILVKGEAMVSGRSGFKSPLPEYAPAIDSLNLVNVDWQALSADKLKVLRDEWTSVFNP